MDAVIDPTPIPPPRIAEVEDVVVGDESNGVPSDVFGARKLRDVMVYYLDRGVAEADIADHLERMQGQIPILRGVENLS